MRFSKVLALLPLLFIFQTACTKKNDNTLWIYTSIYKNVISEMEPLLQKKFPGVNFQWYQSGSENVAARLNAELSTGKPQADLILTSDPFWYLELKSGGHLMNYLSSAASGLAPNLTDPDAAFSTVRICVQVIAFHKEAVTEPPKSWDDLKNPKWSKKISMASPLESGTALALVSQLAHKKGWDYFGGLSKNEILSAGGNSAVIQRIETKERPVGITLLENVLEAQKKGSPIGYVIPTEGAVLIPSPIAILAKTKKPDLAKQVYDYFYSPEMQNAVLHGRMHSPVLVGESPEGAPPFTKLSATGFEWNSKVLADLQAKREENKQRFAKEILH